MLGVLAVGLLPQLRNEQVGYLCHLVRVLHSTQDYLALVALLLQVRRGLRGCRQVGNVQLASSPVLHGTWALVPLLLQVGAWRCVAGGAAAACVCVLWAILSCLYPVRVEGFRDVTWPSQGASGSYSSMQCAMDSSV